MKKQTIASLFILGMVITAHRSDNFLQGREITIREQTPVSAMLDSAKPFATVIDEDNEEDRQEAIQQALDDSRYLPYDKTIIVR